MQQIRKELLMHGIPALQKIMKDTICDLCREASGTTGFLQGVERMTEWRYVHHIPLDAQYMYYKGLEASEGGNSEAALVFLQKAVAIEPRYDWAYYEIGNCLSVLGRYDEAVEQYSRTIAINPFFTEAWVQRDRAMKKAGNQDGGISVFSSAGGI